MIPVLRPVGAEGTGASILVYAAPNEPRDAPGALITNAARPSWTAIAKPLGTATPSYRHPSSAKSP